MFNKQWIALALLPVFALSACGGGNNGGTPRTAAPAEQTAPAEIAPIGENASKEELLRESWKEAVANNYTGSFEDWQQLMKLNETDPAAAQQQAEAAGFTGGDMLMSLLAGMVMGKIASSALDKFRQNRAAGTANAANKNTVNGKNTAAQNNAKSGGYNPNDPRYGGAVGANQNNAGAQNPGQQSQYRQVNPSKSPMKRGFGGKRRR